MFLEGKLGIQLSLQGFSNGFHTLHQGHHYELATWLVHFGLLAVIIVEGLPTIRQQVTNVIAVVVKMQLIAEMRLKLV